LAGVAVAITAAIVVRGQQQAPPPPSQVRVGEMTATPEEIRSGIKEKGYSPYAGRNYPTKVLWGDTHLHTSNSLDARAFGV